MFRKKKKKLYINNISITFHNIVNDILKYELKRE